MNAMIVAFLICFGLLSPTGIQCDGGGHIRGGKLFAINDTDLETLHLNTTAAIEISNSSPDRILKSEDEESSDDEDDKKDEDDKEDEKDDEKDEDDNDEKDDERDDRKDEDDKDERKDEDDKDDEKDEDNRKDDEKDGERDDKDERKDEDDDKDGERDDDKDDDDDKEDDRRTNRTISDSRSEYLQNYTASGFIKTFCLERDLFCNEITTGNMTEALAACYAARTTTSRMVGAFTFQGSLLFNMTNSSSSNSSSSGQIDFWNNSSSAVLAVSFAPSAELARVNSSMSVNATGFTNVTIFANSTTNTTFRLSNSTNTTSRLVNSTNTTSCLVNSTNTTSCLANSTNTTSSFANSTNTTSSSANSTNTTSLAMSLVETQSNTTVLGLAMPNSYASSNALGFFGAQMPGGGGGLIRVLVTSMTGGFTYMNGTALTLAAAASNAFTHAYEKTLRALGGGDDDASSENAMKYSIEFANAIVTAIDTMEVTFTFETHFDNENGTIRLVGGTDAMVHCNGLSPSDGMRRI